MVEERKLIIISKGRDALGTNVGLPVSGTRMQPTIVGVSGGPERVTVMSTSLSFSFGTA